MTEKKPTVPIQYNGDNQREVEVATRHYAFVKANKGFVLETKNPFSFTPIEKGDWIVQKPDGGYKIIKEEDYG